MNIKKILLNYFDTETKKILNILNEEFFNGIEEFRIRANKPLIVINKSKEYFFLSTGELSTNINDEELYYINIKQVYNILEVISQYSLYAFNEELKNGYITLSGGHRVGITGKVVLEHGEIKTLKHINCLNIRVSHEVKGCSDKLIEFLIDNTEVLNTMIISPPCCGKTTLLRDVIRHLSNGIENKIEGQSIGVVDERSEIGGCYQGIPQNDLGIRTDVLDSCPKEQGMLMLLRAMSPKVIAVDEIGKNQDIYAIESIINAGIKLICTAHGYSIEDVKEKDVFKDLINRRVFKRYVILKNIGQVSSIYDEDLHKVF